LQGFEEKYSQTKCSRKIFIQTRRAWPCKAVKNTEIPLPMWYENDCPGCV